MLPDFTKLENQVLDREIAGRGAQLKLLEPQNEWMRPSGTSGELERNLNPLRIEQSFDSVFDTGLRLDDTIAQAHQRTEFFMEGIGNINTVEIFVLMCSGKFS